MYTHRGNPIRFKYYNRIITVYSLEDSSLAKRNMKYIWVRVIKKICPLTEMGRGRGIPSFKPPLPTCCLFTSSFISVSPKNCIWKTKDRNFASVLLFLPSILFLSYLVFPELFILVSLHLAYPGGVVNKQISKSTGSETYRLRSSDCELLNFD